jgi:LytR cell envelope-related transcriptional attenuator
MTDFIAVLEEQLLAAHRERRPRRRPPIPWRGGAIVLAAAATVAAVIAVVIALASPGEHRVASPQPQPAPPQTTPVHPVRRTTVAVLNGTTVTGLARVASDKLVAYGFREGVVTNDTTNQQRQRTTIYYEPGYEEQAQTVAGCLDVGLDRVLPMHAIARDAADRAPIAVFIGTDLAK